MQIKFETEVPQPRILDPESVEDLMAGNVSPVLSAEEDLWNKGQEIAATIETPGYEHIINILSDRVKALRQESSESNEPDKDKLSAQHFKSLGAKELLTFLFHSIDEYLNLEKPVSLQ